jgi:hypothetical protein
VRFIRSESFPALADDLSLVAGDLEPVGARRFAGGRHEVPDRAVVVFHDRADSSSTSIGWVLPMNATAVTRRGIMPVSQ